MKLILWWTHLSIQEIQVLEWIWWVTSQEIQMLGMETHVDLVSDWLFKRFIRILELETYVDLVSDSRLGRIFSNGTMSSPFSVTSIKTKP
jgi:hypothetical protein